MTNNKCRKKPELPKFEGYQLRAVQLDSVFGFWHCLGFRHSEFDIPLGFIIYSSGWFNTRVLCHPRVCHHQRNQRRVSRSGWILLCSLQ